MKSKATTAIQQKEKNTNISVLLIDEITTLSHKFALIVYLLYSLDDESNPVSFASVLVLKSHITMLDFWIATNSFFFVYLCQC